MGRKAVKQSGDKDLRPSQVEKVARSLSDKSSLDELCAAIEMADWLLSRSREIERLKAEKVVKWIESNGEFDFGQRHFSVGYPTYVRCLDAKKTAHALLSAVAGDFDQFLNALVSQPFKYGTVRSYVGEGQFKIFFSTKRTARLSETVRVIARPNYWTSTNRKHRPHPI